MAVLTDAGRAAKKAYKKAWDSKHKEHNRQYAINYWNVKGEELKVAVDKEKNIVKK